MRNQYASLRSIRSQSKQTKQKGPKTAYVSMSHTTDAHDGCSDSDAVAKKHAHPAPKARNHVGRGADDGDDPFCFNALDLKTPRLLPEPSKVKQYIPLISTG